MVRVFGFRAQKLRFFGFGVSCGLRIFSNLGFGFRFLSTMMAVFRILLPNSFYGFSGFANDVTPHTHAKTVIPRNQLQLEECMTSLVSLAAIIWVVTAAKQRRGGTWAIFAGYVPLASQSPYPIVVYSVVIYRLHLSHF